MMIENLSKNDWKKIVSEINVIALNIETKLNVRQNIQMLDQVKISEIYKILNHRDDILWTCNSCVYNALVRIYSLYKRNYENFLKTLNQEDLEWFYDMDNVYNFENFKTKYPDVVKSLKEEVKEDEDCKIQPEIQTSPKRKYKKKK